MKKAFKWTEKHDQFMIMMVRNGASSGKIAQALSQQEKITITRNAVISRCHRRDIRLDASNRKNQKPRAPKKPRPVRKSKTVDVKSFGFQKPDGVRQPPKVDGWPTPVLTKEQIHKNLAQAVKRVLKQHPVSKSVLMQHLGPSDCKWGTGANAQNQHLFCGQPIVPGYTYCPHHTLRGLDLSMVRNRTLRDVVDASNQEEEKSEVLYATGPRGRSRQAA